MPSLKTGELAEQAGVNVETLRFYERKGLLPKPPRRPSGYRDYPPEALERVRFVKRTQELGFSLREIAELLAIGTDPDAGCAEVRQRVEAKVEDIQQKVRDLRLMEQALTRLSESCPGSGPTDDCPLLGLVRFQAESS